MHRDHTGGAPTVGLLSSEADGGFVEDVTVTDARVHDVTDSPLSDEQMDALPIAQGTAMGMLERANVTAGETVVVTCVSGGVVLVLVQRAEARWATVIAATSGGKASDVLAAGSSHTVDRNEAEARVRREPTTWGISASGS